MASTESTGADTGSDPQSWRSARSVPISGRYGGEMTAPSAGKSWIELRIDIDPIDPNSAVTDRVSGDLYDLNRVTMPGGPTNSWRVYRESWIVDKPQVRWSSSSVEIKGTLRYWKGIHPETTILITISWAGSSLGPAEIVFQETSADSARFSCDQISNSFRDLALEIAACKLIQEQPVLPVYNLGAHDNRPTDVQVRTLDFTRAYAEAGVRVSINPTIRQVDDSATNLHSWSSAELYDALQTYYSQAKGEWPNWSMWGILATKFVTPSVGGIMFDAVSERGGKGPSPERKGFAIFRRHPWFNELRDGAPANPSEAAAARQFLYTWVHEAGHAFNFLHSWDKNRPDALSWMNYDWRYDNRNGKDKFWSRFRFRFDDEELIHLRHGDRASVIIGGDPWGSNGSMFAPPGAEYLRFAPGAMARAEGELPLEVLIRSKKYFEFLEPVEIELRLRNLLREYPFTVDTNLDPDYGAVSLFIRGPEGRIVEFSPVTCRMAEPSLKKLVPGSADDSGLDRHSVLLHLTYGSPGFYFDNPGDYLVRAVYHGFGDLVIPSNVLRLRVGSPVTKGQDILAQDFFQHDVGVNLAFDGSVSPYLQKGLDVLLDTSDRYPETMLGAKTAIVAANAIGRPFFRIEDDTLKQSHTPDFDTALSLSDRAVQVFRTGVAAAQQPEDSMNLLYHRISAKRAGLLVSSGRFAAAVSEWQTLRDDLSTRGVHTAVLDSIPASPVARTDNLVFDLPESQINLTELKGGPEEVET